MRNGFGYTGQRDLPEMGLMDYKARMYDPVLMRFIQPDTIVPNPADPQGWNRYSYVRGNPVQYSDPSGHKAACRVFGEECESDPPLDEPGSSADGDESDEAEDPAVAWNSVLVGESSVTPPVAPFTYDQLVQESSCAGCGIEPGNGGAAGAPGLVVDAHNWIQSHNALYGRDIPVFANIVYYRSGKVSVPSIYVNNSSNATISVMQVRFKVQGGLGCTGGAVCITQGSYVYTVAQPRAPTRPGTTAGLGVVKPNEKRTVMLTPSGYLSNPLNKFDRAFTIVVSLGNADTGALFLPISLALP